MIHIVAAVFERNGRFLFGLRSAWKQWLPSHWDLIGGHMEAGETPLEALVREVDEELGVFVTTAEPMGKTLFTREDGEAVTQHVFRITAFEGHIELANDEHTQLAWFKPEEAGVLPNLAAQEYLSLFR